MKVPNNPPIFDTTKINDTILRQHFQMLRGRYNDSARFVEKAYNLQERQIETEFAVLDHANAYVRPSSKGYDIRIASAFPVLLRSLFVRLLSDPEVLPWMEIEGTSDNFQQKVHFTLNPNHLTKETLIQQRITPLRNKVADILADIAMEFVFMHEIAHILAGHVDAVEHRYSEHGNFTEFELVKRVSSTKDKQLSQVWEYEADIIAAGLLNGYLSEFIQTAISTNENSPLRQFFGPHQIAVEQCASLFVIAIYSFFRYLRSTSISLDLQGHHPDPLTRAFCIRDAIFQRTSQNHSIDQKLFEELLSARFEEFDDALENIQIHAGMKLDESGIEKVNQSLSELVALSAQHRHVARPYSFIEWD